jgi:hypothetical protein
MHAHGLVFSLELCLVHRHQEAIGTKAVKKLAIIQLIYTAKHLNEVVIRKMKKGFRVCDIVALRLKRRRIFKQINWHEIDRLNYCFVRKVQKTFESFTENDSRA